MSHKGIHAILVGRPSNPRFEMRYELREALSQSYYLFSQKNRSSSRFKCSREVRVPNNIPKPWGDVHHLGSWWFPRLFRPIDSLIQILDVGHVRTVSAFSAFPILPSIGCLVLHKKSLAVGFCAACLLKLV